MSNNRNLCAALVGAGIFLAGGCATTPQPRSQPAPPPPVVKAPPAAPVTPAPAVRQPTREELLAARLEQLRRQWAQAPYDWKNCNAVGETLLELKEYRAAELVFEQALAVHPISEMLTQEKRRDNLAKARADALRQQQEQQRKAQEMAATNAMMSGLLGSMANMPNMAAGSRQALNVMTPMLEGFANAEVGMAQAQAMVTGSVAELAEYGLPARKEKAALWFNLGQAQAGYGNNVKAAASLESAFQFDPARYDILWRLALAWREEGRPDKALLVANRYLAMMPGGKNMANCLVVMDLFRALRLPEEADAAFDGMAAVGRAPDSADVRNLMEWGDFCNRAGRFGEALPAYAAAYRKAAIRDTALLNGLAVAYLSTGKPIQESGLIAEMSAGAEKARAPDYQWYLAGSLHELSGNPQGAREAFLKAVERWEKEYAGQEIPGHIAVCFAAIGRLPQAATYLHATLRGDRNGILSGRDYFRIVGIHEKAGRPELAMLFCRLSLRETPGFRPAELAMERLARNEEANVKASLAQAEAALRDGDKAKAILALSAAAALMPGGEKQDALYADVLRLAVGMENPPPVPEAGRAHWLRGNAICKQVKSPADIHRALMEYQMALAEAPWMASLWLNVAVCHGLLNDYDNAVREIKMYLNGTADPKAAGDSWDKLYELEQQWNTARRELKGLNPFKKR